MRRTLALSLAVLAQAGCSLTGLSDYTIFECTTHADCEPLNMRRGVPADQCVRYHCAADSHCRLQPRDLDRDGHATTACASAPECGEEIACDDCDDTAAAAYPGQSEACDGVDNDCNDIVDDVTGGAAPNATTLVSGASSVQWHDYGAALSGSPVEGLAFIGGSTRTTYFNVVERDPVDPQAVAALSGNLDELVSSAMEAGCPLEMASAPNPRTAPVGSGVTADTCQTHDDCDDGVLCNGYELCDPSDPDASPDDGCVAGNLRDVCDSGSVCDEARAACLTATATGCSFAELATAETRDSRERSLWLGAMLQQSGCHNLVRLGWFHDGTQRDDMTGEPGRNLLIRGDSRRTTSYAGVDPISSGGVCTGASRPAGQPTGARLVSLAALPADASAGRRRPQGLAAWLVPVESGGQPVEVIGVWEEEYSTAHWVSASGDAIPQQLESASVGDVRPALASWVGVSNAGYFVAYGVSGGGVAVRFVPAFADPPEVGDVPPYTTGISASSPALARTTPDIVLGDEQRIDTSGEATNVQLAVGRTDGDSVELALAWHDGDGVQLATLTFTGSSFDVGAPSAVSPDDAEEIALGYASSGLVMPGFERSGATADESSSGGWLVAWRTGGEIRGARFAELDGERLDPEVMRIAGDVSRLSIYTGTAADDAGSQRLVPRVVFHDRGLQEFRRTDAFCGPAE